MIAEKFKKRRKYVLPLLKTTIIDNDLLHSGRILKKKCIKIITKLIYDINVLSFARLLQDSVYTRVRSVVEILR